MKIMLYASDDVITFDIDLIEIYRRYYIKCVQNGKINFHSFCLISS